MQQNKLTWHTICNSFVQNPRDVITVPKNKKGKWFFVCAEKDGIFIESAKEHNDSCRIKGRRRLEENKLESMLNIYYKRLNGESVTKEAAKVTFNQIYWYGIFAELGL